MDEPTWPAKQVAKILDELHLKYTFEYWGSHKSKVVLKDGNFSIDIYTDTMVCGRYFCEASGFAPEGYDNSVNRIDTPEAFKEYVKDAFDYYKKLCEEGGF